MPAQDYAVSLTVGQGFDTSDFKIAAKLGVTEKELDVLRIAVTESLAKGPLESNDIYTATRKASRNPGEDGREKGLTTTLPEALSRLQSEGKIRRVPVNGRLDQQHYAYAVWKPKPLSKEAAVRPAEQSGCTVCGETRCSKSAGSDRSGTRHFLKIAVQGFLICRATRSWTGAD